MIDEQKQPTNISEIPETEQSETISDTDSNMSDSIVQDQENRDEAQSPNEDTKNLEEVEEKSDQQEQNILAENEQIIATLQQENANLKKLYDEQVEVANNAKAQYARLAADFDNFRKRTVKEKENLEQRSKKQIIVDLLPVIDNFERARTQLKPSNEGEKSIHSSYQGVYKTLVDCLKRMGVSAMRPEGKDFDPNFHEAMLREPTNEHPEGTVIEQLMRGYLLGDQVIRHAMVKVAVPQENKMTSEATESLVAEQIENEKVDNSEG